MRDKLVSGLLLIVQYLTELQYETCRGDSANVFPHDMNYASEFPTFGEIAEVNLTGVQWSSLALGKCFTCHIALSTHFTNSYIT